eukprot:TRINITY_DN6324_c0_g1_i1.p2 TRINITY_DN6324_c0_g1~~TRINITY_DN6324_c0_g1_i1.p2  ORF type:complete len:254 (+),score=34.31 TRINITY_DN6324_c0_g1_i1:319-1080(+)
MHGQTRQLQATIAMDLQIACQGFADCLSKEASVFGPTAPLEETAGCLNQVCTGSANSTTTSTSAGHAPGPHSHDVSQADLQETCPDVVSQCKSDSVCGSAWTCMAKRDDCDGFADCLSEEASVFGPTAPLEETVRCLVQVCMGSASSTTASIVSTSAGVALAPSPGTSQADLQAACSNVVTQCGSDSPCNSVWTCIGAASGCDGMGRCLSDAAAVPVDQHLEELASCMSTICQSQLTKAKFVVHDTADSFALV